jgi:hypothetical protein
MITGLDPITQEEYDIKEWLMMDNHNIILNITYNDKNNLYLINKNLLDIPNLKNIYNKCIYNKNIFLPSETYKSKENYINIGYLIGKKCLIPEKQIKSIFLKKNNKIINLDITNKSYNFINKENLLLQYIGLYKERINKNDSDKVKLQKKSFNKNIPYKLDVYFEKILSDALFDYSFLWDAPINYYLREGDAYFNGNMFKKYRDRYGETKKIAIRNIKNKIKSLDRVFLEAAPRNEDDKTFYWRGMKTQFKNLYYINDSIVAQNFLSLSHSYDIAYSFSGFQHGKDCCIYKFVIDKGVPVINMINTTKYKKEKETLLPRNVTCTLINKEYIDDYGIDISIYTLRVSLNNINDFKLTNMCYNYSESNISISKNKELNKYISNSNISHKNTKKLIKKTRCPNGTRRNPKTGLCESLIKNNVVVNVQQVKKTRCPNGTRKNKITGICEPK